MTKRQVTLVMGSPAVVSPFDQNRWDYVSTLRRGNGRMETKDLTLYFEGDALYPGAGFRRKNHIQIAVRSVHCIKGYFRLPGM